MVTASRSLLEDIKDKYSSDNVFDAGERIQRRLILSNNEMTKYSVLNQTTQFISLIDRLKNKYELCSLLEPTEKCIEQNINVVNFSSVEILSFNDNCDHNRQKLCVICDNAKELRSKYSEIINGDETIYLKTVDNFINKMDSIIGKGDFSPNKVSDKLKKALSLTVIKNFANSKLSLLIDDFLAKCGFKKVELPIGKRVEDDDFKYIPEFYLKIDVKSPDMHNTIIDKKHDAYVFNCYDTDEEEYCQKIIPGEYSIGCWKE